MIFVIYATATGEVRRAVRATNSEMVQGMCALGENFLEASAGVNDSTHYVQDSALVAFPAKPHPTATWDWTTKTWSTDLVAAKKAKWEGMKAARLEAEYGGFTFQTNEYASDVLSAAKIVAYFTMAKAILDAGQTFQAPWILKDGETIVMLNANELVQLGKAFVTFLRDLNEQLRQRRQSILAATTLAQVDAVVW
jgi:hypothetical protein